MRIPGNIIRLLFQMSAILLGSAAQAQVATANLSVQIIITGGCAVQNVSGVNFGSFPLLTSNIDNTGSFDVVCTTGVPYSISLNGGGGGSIGARRMTTGSANIGYQLYSDAARTLVWGETLNVDRVIGTGNGAAQPQTVFARVPPQTTPAPGTYIDSVTISVNY